MHARPRRAAQPREAAQPVEDRGVVFIADARRALPVLPDPHPPESAGNPPRAGSQPTRADELAHLAVDDLQRTGRSRPPTPVGCLHFPDLGTTDCRRTHPSAGCRDRTVCGRHHGTPTRSGVAPHRTPSRRGGTSVTERTPRPGGGRPEPHGWGPLPEPASDQVGGRPLADGGQLHSAAPPWTRSWFRTTRNG